jgi:ankyrin repeat protein
MMNRKGSTIVAICLPAVCVFFLAGCDDIRKAARQGDLDAVKKYVEQGVKVNERSGDGETALHWACREGHAEVAHYLLSKGADVSEEGTGCGTPLQWAVQAGQRKMVILLLDNGAEINQHGTDEFTALHDAVLKQDVQMVKLLLDRGADPNAKASYDRTPLFCVERYARNETISDLLRQYGAKDDSTQPKDTGRQL